MEVERAAARILLDLPTLCPWFVAALIGSGLASVAIRAFGLPPAKAMVVLGVLVAGFLVAAAVESLGEEHLQRAWDAGFLTTGLFCVLGWAVWSWGDGGLRPAAIWTAVATTAPLVGPYLYVRVRARDLPPAQVGRRFALVAAALVLLAGLNFRPTDRCAWPTLTPRVHVLERSFEYDHARWGGPLGPHRATLVAACMGLSETEPWPARRMDAPIRRGGDERPGSRPVRRWATGSGGPGGSCGRSVAMWADGWTEAWDGCKEFR